MSHVLIIGAKSDIGKAVARKYAEHGYDLYLAARNAGELESFAKDITIRTRRSVQTFEFDILNYENHQTFYDQLEKEPSGVISTVGYLGDQETAQTDPHESKLIIDSNYTGVVIFLNVIANAFEKRRSGFIIGISSVAGDRGRRSNYLYGSAKAALNGYLSGLRNRLCDAHVHVLTVKPGFVATKMTAGMDLPEKLTAQPEKVAEDIYNAQQKNKNVLYTKWLWRWIMLIIRMIPESKFKKMNI
jgi:short-subunit dehydrogenase